MSTKMKKKNGSFILDSNTGLDDSEWESRPVQRAVQRFFRDMRMTLETQNIQNVQEIPLSENTSRIYLKKAEFPEEEMYRIQVSERQITVEAGDELGIIYALIYLSRVYLGVQAFWFWNDQKFEKKDQVEIAPGQIDSERRPVRFRGWFINDEVLLSKWDAGVSEEYPWEMALEALLRCGGNMVIPGTDKNSKRYGPLASEMGFWITQHHAEPLGAEMFLRVWPDKEASFQKYPELFRQLWREGIERQKNWKIIWNLGFRGQGDTPFWEQDPQYDTPQKRGALISSIMMEQYELVCQYVENPLFCVNLYGEVMELYNQGYLTLPDNVIMIWADNGYGKMVSRRQWNHDPRIVSLPPEQMKDRKHGVYYHVSFYDLQSANVLTMIPNSMEFIGRELETAYESGIQEFWLVNCSNVKPHVYPLDYVASRWNGERKTAEEHRNAYIATYYPSARTESEEEKDQTVRMSRCFENYFKMMLHYGEKEDQHAGEQFYNYVTRVMIWHWMKYGETRRCEELDWCARQKSFSEQVQWYGELCRHGLVQMEQELEQVRKLEDVAGQLWKDSLSLQVKIHTYCCKGAVLFAQSYQSFQNGEYKKAFYEIGCGAEWYEKADQAMVESGHDKWKGFYANDCQTDIRETGYLLRQLMGYVRNMEDGPYFYEWQREVLYAPKDRKILLLTNEERHMTDMEIFKKMKEK